MVQSRLIIMAGIGLFVLLVLFTAISYAYAIGAIKMDKNRYYNDD